MRVLPNMVVVAPGDSIEAEKATRALAENGKPSYLRLAREKSPVFTTDESPFEIGKAYVLKEGSDVSLLGTGALTYQLLIAAKLLEKQGIDAEVVHVPTIKPLDEATILASSRKTGRVVTAEEAQAAGGFGSAVTEFLSAKLPMPVKRIGVNDRFGESGSPSELLNYFGFTGEKLAKTIFEFTEEFPRYHQH
jgi:transketolase